MLGMVSCVNKAEVKEKLTVIMDAITEIEDAVLVLSE